MKGQKLGLNGWYAETEILDYDICVNGKIRKTREILNECCKYFNEEHKYLCFLTQGDPNVLNIGIKPIFFDFNTAGYNYYVAEFSTFMWSILIADAYFCPKYHMNSYYNHEEICHKQNKYKPEIIYKIENKCITIEGKAKTSNIRANFVLKYLEMLKNNNLKINKDIIYFLIMRILCIFNLNEMSEFDKIYCLYFVHTVYEISTIGEETETILIDLIKNMNKI